MAPPKLTFYFDLVSPFAYLAWYFVRTNAAFKQCEVTLVPAWLAGIMKETDNKPPIAIKNKSAWINKERLRWATHFSIPMASRVPPGFPIRTLDVQRMLCALQARYPERLPEVVDELYALIWTERVPAHTADGFGDVVRKVLGEKAEEVLDAAGTEGKEALMRNTEAAVRSGAFGMPWFVATNSMGETEAFWGFDHLGQVMLHLGLERPDVKAML